MTMLSVAYSHSSSTLSLPPLSLPKIHGCLSSPTILAPVSTLKSSGFPPRLSINGNLNSRRNRFRANSVDPDGDVQITTQFTQGNDGISKDTSGSNPSTSFLSVLCPLLKLFSGGDPAQERNYFLEVATSSLSTLARLPWGSRSLTDNLHSQEMSAVDPPNNLQLFEFEACPFCRRVREAITELDLSVEIYPCPKGSIRHREMVRSVGGKEQYMFIMLLCLPGEIVKYLFQQYGNGRSPSTGLLESTLITGWMPTILRAGRGMSLWEKARTEPPPKKLELFSYENNPYARIVREALCELELPYVLQSVGEGSRRTNLLVEASGSKELIVATYTLKGTAVEGDEKAIIIPVYWKSGELQHNRHGNIIGFDPRVSVGLAFSSWL
ncbi:hypothetical protein RHGRI_033051 [Rhododendron griersonianum]|uniref:GST N-terminal domain-containing protein n=1 Tax=Rhododendron griersonianum TaxID=479676 RepID=A0AAV6HXX5_9ERIC|nr:hypothetical protein RHGRI_033051 [Rhododendron griersonianum]